MAAPRKFSKNTKPKRGTKPVGTPSVGKRRVGKSAPTDKPAPKAAADKRKYTQPEPEQKTGQKPAGGGFKPRSKGGEKENYFTKGKPVGDKRGYAKPEEGGKPTDRKPTDRRFKPREIDKEKEGAEGEKRERPAYGPRPGGNFKRKPNFKPKGKGQEKRNPENEGTTRLNKYIANAGICSRREADTLIQQGLVTVNDVSVTELGYRIKPGDKVKYAGHVLKGEALRYVLLNKPKDYITTSKDPQNRKTVMHLVSKACKERIYPIGRLDRNTTGLLLFTNDGEMAKKLSHPKFGVKKIYHVWLDKNFKSADMEKIVRGLELEDGPVTVDSIAYVNGASKKEVGVEIHSGRNRIVRRMFAHLGYTVVKLDRVAFATLTKKDLPRGTARHLSETELNMLKMTIK